MVERDPESHLSEILKAAADPTRRAILTLLVQHGPTRVTDLAARFDTSLNAVSKHIKVLEGAGLVSRRTAWREHLIEAQLGPIGEIDRWFGQLRLIWDMRLEELEKLLAEETNEMTDLTLTARRTIKAPPERVFNAWLNPQMFARIMKIGPDMDIADPVIDPRIGGRFSFLVKMSETDAPHSGTYLDITRHSRIAFTWESPYSTEGSTVTITFAEVPGGTDVTLNHVKFKSEDSRDGHFKGWTAILGNLDAAMA
mgnify:FL=1